MGKKELPPFFEKRAILYSDDVPVERVNEVGREFMEAELYDEALEFFDRTKSEEDVRRVADIAFKNGDVGVWLRCKRILTEDPDEQSLQGIAANAEAQKKYMFAAEAWRRLGDEEQVERLLAAFEAESQ